MDEAFKKWGALGKNAKVIAQGLFQASEGKVTKLNCRTWNDDDSIWERALRIIFPGQKNTPRDRFLLWSFWIQERKGVFEEYQKLRGKPLARSQKATQSQDTSKKDQGHCFCQRTYKLVHNVPMLQCDVCLQWMHGICADKNAMDFKGDRSFVCDICTGKTTIPPIFLETPKSSPAGTVQAAVDRDPTSTEHIDPTSSTPPFSGNRKSGPENAAAAGRTLFPGGVSKDNIISKDSLNSEHEFEDISSDESVRSEKITQKTSHATSQISEKSDVAEIKIQLDDNDSNATGEITITGEEKNYELLQQQIEEESFRQDQERIKVPVSSDFMSQLSLNVDPDEEDDLELNHPVSPKKKNPNQPPISDSDTEGDENDVLDFNPVKTPKVSVSEPLDEDDEEFIDTSQIPSAFTDTIKYDEWRKFVRTKEDDDKISKEKGYKQKNLRYTNGMRIDSEYTHIFSSIFDRYNWTCVLAFTRINFNPNAPRAPFLTSYAKCVKPPRKCPVQYSFIIRETPKISVSKDVHLEVKLMTSVGPLHPAGYKGHRRLHGEVLKDFQKELKDKKASTLRSSLLSNANQKAMETGKLNDVKSLSSLRQTRAVAKKEEDLDEDIMKDILATRLSLLDDFPSKLLPGYLQHISLWPFKVVMFSKMQFDLLNRMTKRFGPRTLQLDETGQLVKKLPAPYDQRDVSICTIIVRSPKTGEQVLPVAEMISTDNTTASIAYFLKLVFESYRKTCNVTLPHYGVERLELDFGKANLGAVVNVFTGLTVSQYLNKLWHIMNGDPEEETSLFPIHICRFHVIRALEAHLKKGVGVSPDEESKIVIRKWFHRLTHAKTLWTYHRLCVDAAFFFGQLYLTKQLLERIENIDSATDKSGTKPWENFTFTNEKRLDIPFYKRTPYGAYAEDIFDQMGQHNRKLGTSGKNIQYNPMYDPAFLATLKLHYMPYFPIISSAVIEHLGVKSDDRTTNAIEQYHGLLKTSIYPKETYLKAPRFLRRQAQFIKGSCNNQLAVLASIKPKPKHASSSQSEKTTAQRKNEETASDNTNIKTPKDILSQNNSDEDDSSAETNKKGKTGPAKTQLLNPVFDESDDGLVEDNSQNDKPTSKPKKKTATTYPFDDDNGPSPESQKDIWKGKKKKQPKSESVVDSFDVPLVHWGGKVKINDTIIVIGNSCAMDTTCQILLAMYKKNLRFKEFLDTAAHDQTKEKYILQTLLCFLKGESDGAKTCWLTEALGLTQGVISSKEFYSEAEYGWKALEQWFPIKRNYWCSNEDCVGFQDREFWIAENVTLLDLHPFSVDHFLTMVNGEIFAGYKCTQCLSRMKTDVTFEFEDMPFIFYGVNENGHGKSREDFLRYTQKIKGVTYKVFAYTVLLNEGKPSAHFVTKFVLNYKKIVYNGLDNNPVSQGLKTNEIVTSVWLYPEF